jgi:polyisoprenoid-binding protein YceI
VTRYRFVPDKSTVWIDGKSTLHAIHSKTDGLEGYIDLPDGAGEPSGTLSFAVKRLSSGNRMEDRELHRRIDAKRHPTIDGVITAMTPAGDEDRYRVRGDLTFRGVTRSVEDELTVTVIDDRTVRLEGSSQFDVRDFGMEPPRILVMRVYPEVNVRVEIVAQRD